MNHLLTNAVLSLRCLLGLLLVMLAVTPAAHALAVTLTDIQAQTVAGENFTFNFSSIPASDGTSGVFTIHARGDYDPGTLTEFLTWDIDSLGIGGAAGPTIGGVTIIQNNSINDVEWTQSFVISGLNMLAITADFFASILIDLNGDQDAGVGVGFQPNEFVEVTLEYNSAAATVPEPGTLVLLGTGATWLVRRRRATS